MPGLSTVNVTVPFRPGASSKSTECGSSIVKVCLSPIEHLYCKSLLSHYHLNLPQLSSEKLGQEEKVIHNAPELPY
jgi:hypothetical protein